MHNTCRTTSIPNSDCSLMHYRNMAIWILWNINIPRSLNSRDSFPRRKFENQAPKSCRRGPILSLPTISFELQAKMAEEMDVVMCSFRQFLVVQKLRDLDLRSGRCHTCAHIWSRSTYTPNEIEIGKFLWTYGRMYGRTHLSSNLLGHCLAMTS